MSGRSSLLLSIIFFFSLIALSQAQYGVSPFLQTASYPTNATGFSCVTNSSYVYCVGGYALTGNSLSNKPAYYAELTANGISNWKETASYPGNFLGNDCVSGANHIYCIGYLNDGQDTYFANLTQNGIENWRPTSNYPLVNISELSCTPQSGYVYCIGMGADLNAPSNSTYYANITSTGLGPWIQSSNYPVNLTAVPDCFGGSNFVYCLGGFTNSSYYSYVNASGINGWRQSANYSESVIGNSCIEANTSDAYCVGGFEFGLNVSFDTTTNSISVTTYNGVTNSIYFGFAYSDGVLNWYKSNESYPMPVYQPECVEYNATLYNTTMYCIGGQTYNESGGLVNTNSSYYAQMYYLSSLPTATSSSTSPSTSTVSQTGATAPPTTLSNSNFTTQTTQSTTIPNHNIGTGNNQTKTQNTTSLNTTNSTISNSTKSKPPSNNSVNTSVSNSTLISALNQSNVTNTTSNSIGNKKVTSGAIIILIVLIVIIAVALLIWFTTRKRGNA